MNNTDRAALAHVLWLGGAPDAGKSSAVRKLGERHAFRWYNVDHFEPAHLARMTGGGYPATDAFLALTLDERWVEPSAAAMARAVTAFWRERFPLVLEDLRAWPRDHPIVVEGPGLFPDDVAPLLTDPRQALWLVPTPAFKRAAFATRENKRAIAEQTRDPARARRNMIARDLLLARQIAARCATLGLTTRTVDGSRSVAAMADALEAHFPPIFGPRGGA